MPSSESKLQFGVPQGSVLGPLLFTFYTSPIADIADKHGVNHHLYADVTHIYVPLEQDCRNQIAQLERCVQEISSWMESNKLKLNCDKTDVVVMGTKRQVDTCNIKEVSIDGCSIKLSDCDKNLGCLIDSTLTMSGQITDMCKKSYFHLKNIGKIREYIDKDTAQLLVSALVMSRLDYCNSLLAGLPQKSLDRLQKVQNQAARIVSLTKRRDHITPVLKSLHWLPIKDRVNFKVLCHTFKCQTGTSPVYLHDLLSQHVPQRNLRSGNRNMLDVPLTRASLGDRAFSVHGPKLWNNLPDHLKSCSTLESFKKHLKTYFFSQTYD